MLSWQSIDLAIYHNIQVLIKWTNTRVHLSLSHGYLHPSVAILVVWYGHHGKQSPGGCHLDWQSGKVVDLEHDDVIVHLSGRVDPPGQRQVLSINAGKSAPSKLPVDQSEWSLSKMAAIFKILEPFQLAKRTTFPWSSLGPTQSSASFNGNVTETYQKCNGNITEL